MSFEEFISFMIGILIGILIMGLFWVKDSNSIKLVYEKNGSYFAIKMDKETNRLVIIE